MSNTAINRAIELAQQYLWAEDLEEGRNEITIEEEDGSIGVDMEVYCYRDVTYHPGTYLIPPSISGKITNEPVKITAWYFDSEDNLIEQDITKLLKPYKFSA